MQDKGDYSKEELDKYIGLVISFWKKREYYDVQNPDYWQDAYCVVMDALNEYDPEKGKLSTCISKVALRYFMRSIRQNKKIKMQRAAATLAADTVYTDNQITVSKHGKTLVQAAHTILMDNEHHY